VEEMRKQGSRGAGEKRSRGEKTNDYGLLTID
jgi:hypothetical protein